MKKLNKVVNVFQFSLLLFLFKSGSAFAQIGKTTVGVDSSEWFENLFIWIIGLAGVVSAAVLIFNAFLFITAGGDEGKIQKASKGITFAIIGLVIAAIAFLIVNFVIGEIDRV